MFRVELLKLDTFANYLFIIASTTSLSHGAEGSLRDRVFVPFINHIKRNLSPLVLISFCVSYHLYLYLNLFSMNSKYFLW